MPGRRSVVDHALRRRALVAPVHAGRTEPSGASTVEVGCGHLVRRHVLDSEPVPVRAPRRNRRRVATE